MEHRKNTETHRLMLEEIERHTIKILPDDTDRIILVKISDNLNGKTEAIAKLRRGQTAMMSEISKMPTAEQFQSVKVMAEIHEERWKRFDQLCTDALTFAKKVWTEIKDTLWKGFKNASILFITVLCLYIIWAVWNHYFPGIKLQQPSPVP